MFTSVLPVHRSSLALAIGAVLCALSCVLMAVVFASKANASPASTTFSAVASPATAGSVPMTCEQLIGPETVAQFSALGMQLDETGMTGGADSGTADSLRALGGLYCLWGQPGSDLLSSAGFAQLDDAAASAEIQRITANGFLPASDGTTTNLTIDPSSPNWAQTPFDVGFVHEFSDGVWLYASGADSLELVRANVAAYLAANASPTPQPQAATPPPVEEEDFSWAAPSVLSELRTFQDVNLSAAGAVLTATGVVVFSAILAFPAKLFEGAGQSIREALERNRVARAVLERGETAVDGKRRLVFIAAGVAVAAFLASFLEEDFGNGWGSVRVFATLVATYAIESVAATLLVRRLLGAGTVAPRLRLSIAALVVVGLAVLASRLVGFQPGLVFGSIIVLAYAVAPSERLARRQALTEIVVLFLLGIASWGAFSLCSALGIGVGEDAPAAQVFLLETFAGLTIGALAALPILLIPIAGMPGRDVVRFGWGTWVVVYAVCLGVFLVALLPLPDSWDGVDGPIVLWVSLYALYLVLAVAAWMFHRWWSAKVAAEAASQTERAGV